MMIIGIVGLVFAALAVTGLWLDMQDPQELRDMGVVLGYKDEQAVKDSVVVAKPERRTKRRTSKASKRSVFMRTYPINHKPRAGGVH